ncbi:MAG: phosphotransferase family protein, partial [Blastocatellia bacterium]
VCASLEILSGLLQKQTCPHVICHGDLHPANLIRESSGRVFVIDWDDVMLAPKERDFVFVDESPVDHSGALMFSPFFQGYGETEMDWIALTYYRYERVAQDLIECARRLFYQDDLSEVTKAGTVQLFHELLSGGGVLEAAYRSAVNCSSGLLFRE